MTRLNWDAVGERYFETGVDHGVLYIGGAGYAWPGLIKVDESPTGGEAKPYYIDGVKFANVALSEEFEATISAFYAPPEFRQCDGVGTLHAGLFATQQPRKKFDFSYRTLIGNDIDGAKHAYKIHIVYGALAAPASRSHATLSDSVTVSQFDWDLTTLPPRVPGIKPTAHFVIDSRSTPPILMATIEEMLYGGPGSDARLPTAIEFVSIFDNYLYLRPVETSPGVWEIFETEPNNARFFMQDDKPTIYVAPTLWLNTSQGDYAEPFLVTGD